MGGLKNAIIVLLQVGLGARVGIVGILLVTTRLLRKNMAS